jgi:hypothetical protein
MCHEPGCTQGLGSVLASGSGGACAEANPMQLVRSVTTPHRHGHGDRRLVFAETRAPPDGRRNSHRGDNPPHTRPNRRRTS